MPPGSFFSTLEQISAEYVGRGLRQSRGDKVWRARLRGGGPDDCLYLAIMLEFQSKVDRFMAARVVAYTGQLHQKIMRGKDFPADGKLPPVLPIVIYNGRTRWSAPEEALDLIADTSDALIPFQPRQRYLLLDAHALNVEDLPPDNIVSAQIALEQGAPRDIAPALRQLRRLVEGPEHRELSGVLAEWLEALFENSLATGGDPALAAALDAARKEEGANIVKSRLAERLDEWYERMQNAAVRAEERGIALGMERGIEGERSLLSRQAARKFGAETAARLTALLTGIADRGRLEEIGDLVIDCNDGEELLARIAGAGAPH